jgi:site-specific DNA-methyltransferase (adenine-specific)
MLEINKIYCMDCLKGLEQMEDNSVDITITSPPYNAGNNVRGNFYDEYSDNLPSDEYYNFIKSTVKELIRVNKHYVFFNFQVLSGNKLAYLQLLSDFKENIKDIIIWHKTSVQPSIQPTRLNSAFEFVIVFSKKELAEKQTFERAFFNNRVRGQLNNNVIYMKNASNETFDGRNENKAIYPVDFVKWFLQKFTDKGDLVLDPFMGSGTTAVACKELHRNYIGFELSQQYCDIANQRLDKWKGQATLF